MISAKTFIEDEKTYYEEREDLRKIAAQQEEKFLQTDFLALRKNNHEEYFASLVNYYLEFSIFNNAEIRKKFNSAGLNNFWLKWLIPIEVIEEKLENIIADGKIRVLRVPVLGLIRFHLESKICREMAEWADYMTTYDKEEISMAKKIFIGAYRNRRYGKGTPKTFKNLADRERHKILSGYEKDFGGRKIVKKELLQYASGDTNYLFLRPMVKFFIKDGQTNMTEFCNIIYDFFLLIIKDDETMYATEGEYVDKASEVYDTFRIYKKEKILKTFIREPK